MKNLKTYLILLALGSTNLFANEEIPVFSTLKTDLESMLQTKTETQTLETMKKVANERNTDVEVAFQNYIIAKKHLSIARAAFNPLTTGTALGIALGLNFLWAEIAVDAVLSIPTKIYDVKTNKYLEVAALYNTYEARQALNNEMAHLYYDIVTHEVILKSIDSEIAIRKFQVDSLAGTNKVEIDYTNATILKLKMQRIDVYNLYVEELAALRTMISIDPNATQYILAQNSKEISKSFLEGMDLDNLGNFALVNNSNYKKMINLHHAAETNVKAVKWSIITLTGLNFSYKSRVEAAKNDEVLARLEQISRAMIVKNSALLQYSKFDSALNISEYYNDVSSKSLNFLNDTYKMYLVGTSSPYEVLEAAVTAIHEFRSKVVAHYSAWSSLDDLSTSINTKLVYNDQSDRMTSQIENSPIYGISENNYKVVLKGETDSAFKIAISSANQNLIKKVTYKFNEKEFPTTTSKSDNRDFQAYVYKNENTPSSFSGYAIIELNNGHEIEENFKF